MWALFLFILFLFLFLFLFYFFFLLPFVVVCFWIFFFVFLLKCVNKLTKKIKSMNLTETQTRARQEPFDFMSVRVTDERKMLHPCAIQLCDKWKYGGGLGFENNNPAVSNYPGHLVKKTGVRTLTVLHNHDNKESPFIDKHGVNRDLEKKHWCLSYHFQSSMGAGTLYFFP